MYNVNIGGLILSKEQLLSVKSEIIELCETHGIRFLAMTGPIEDGISRPRDAVHLVYDYDRVKVNPVTIYTFQKALEELVGKKVHLVYGFWFGDMIMDFILKTAVVVYGNVGGADSVNNKVKNGSHWVAEDDCMGNFQKGEIVTISNVDTVNNFVVLNNVCGTRITTLLKYFKPVN